jgi:hypothetical protein
MLYYLSSYLSTIMWITSFKAYITPFETFRIPKTNQKFKGLPMGELLDTKYANKLGYYIFITTNSY